VHPGQRQCESRSSIARFTFGDKTGVVFPAVSRRPLSSTRTGSIFADARNASTMLSGNGIPTISAGPETGTCTTRCGAGPLTALTSA